MNELNELLRYQLKYIYSVEVHAESFFRRLKSTVKSKELTDLAEVLEEEAHRKKNRIDSMCRNFFIDPRGHYSKSMMGFVEDIDFLLQSSFPSEIRNSAVKMEIPKILQYQRELYNNLLDLAQNLKYYDLSREISRILKTEAGEVELTKRD